MRTTIDKAGRVVIPKALRERAGLGPGQEVEVTEDGGGVSIEAVNAGGRLEQRDGLLVIVGDGTTITDDDVSALRDALRR